MPRLQNLELADIPKAEDERFEYKSSATEINELKKKIGQAASGFWNSGGGIFIAGVDDAGKPDGGFAPMIGRQPIRAWVDQALHRTSPTGKYDVHLFSHDSVPGLNIAANHCVIAIEFEESAQPPHMAPDNKYYIRAGVHTVPASQYIVEALWARRRLQCPQLAHTLRFKPEASDIIQLVVLPLTEEPAINVTITLDPLPQMWKDSKASFPVRLPVLDRTTPFYLDVTTFYDAEKRLGEGVHLRVHYEDIAKNRYDYTALLDIKSIAPWRIGTPANEKGAKSLESIDKTLQKIPTALDKLRQENAELRGELGVLKRAAFAQRAGGCGAIVELLGADARAIMLAAKDDGTIIFSPYIGGSQLHAGKIQFISSKSDAREEARWKCAVSELRDIELIDGVFERGGSSIFRLTHFGYEVADAITQRPEPEDTIAGDAEM